MQHLPEDHCAQLMDQLRNRETCEWCRHPHEEILPRVRLCNHCNRIRLKLQKMERQAEQFIAERGGLTFGMQNDLRVQRAMVEHAQIEGQTYGGFYDDDLLPLGLENQFRTTSVHYVGKDLFNGISNDLNWSFSLNQRRYVYYLLSLMNREWMRKGRRQHARWMVQQAILDEPPGRPRPLIVGDLRD